MMHYYTSCLITFYLYCRTFVTLTYFTFHRPRACQHIVGPGQGPAGHAGITLSQGGGSQWGHCHGAIRTLRDGIVY